MYIYIYIFFFFSCSSKYLGVLVAIVLIISEAEMEKEGHPIASKFQHALYLQLHIKTNCRTNSQIPRKDNLIFPAWIKRPPLQCL